MLLPCDPVIGCPSTAIAMEELARVGATTFVRIGTCGSLQERVCVGDVAIVHSAARYDWTSSPYARGVPRST